MQRPPMFLFFFFFNDTATTEIYTLSLHDALPISLTHCVLMIYDVQRSAFVVYREDATVGEGVGAVAIRVDSRIVQWLNRTGRRSEEHTSELQSRPHLVCRLLLEKKNKPLRDLVAP